MTCPVSNDSCKRPACHDGCGYVGLWPPPRCTGSYNCEESWHFHGCFKDDGRCDSPGDHEETIYEGTEPAKQCAWFPCQNWLLDNFSDDAQWCSKNHRDLSHIRPCPEVRCAPDRPINPRSHKTCYCPNNKKYVVWVWP